MNKHHIIIIIFVCLSHILFPLDSSIGRIFLVEGDNKYPPYEFINSNNQPDGYNIDLFRAVAKATGIKYKIELKSWTEVRLNLETNKCDIVTGMYYSEERDEKIDFTSPYLVVFHSIFSRFDNSFNKIRDLKDKSILVLQGDIMHDFLITSDITNKIIPVKDQQEALRLLSEGNFDAAILARLQGLYFINSLEYDNIVVSKQSINPREYCFAVKEDDSELQALLNEGLNIIKNNGELKRIHQKWFGAYEKIELWNNYKYYIILLIIIAVISFLVFIFLRIEISKKTEHLTEQIKQRKKIEKDLKESNEGFKLILENSSDLIYKIILESGKCEYVSPSALDVTGYNPQHFYENNFFIKKIIHPEFKTYIKNMFNGFEAGFPKEISNFKIIDPSGSERWILQKNKLIYEGAKPYAVLCNAIDNSLQKNEHLSLKDSISKWKSTFNAIKSGMCILTLDGIILNYNKSFTAFKISEIDEIISKNYLEVLGLDSSHNSLLIQTIKEFKRNSLIIEHDSQWFQLSMDPIINNKGNLTYIVFLIDNITDDIQIQNRLIESESQYREIYQKSIIGMYRMSTKGEIIMANPAVLNMLGYPDLSQLNKALRNNSIIDLDNRIKMLEKVDKKELIISDSIWMHANGEKAVFHETINFCIENDRVLYYEGTLFNITKQIEAEQKLELVKYSLDRTTDEAYWINSKGIIKYVNESSLNELGYNREEIINQDISFIDNSININKWKTFWNRLKKEQSMKMISYHKRKDGSEYPVEIINNYLLFNELEYVFSYCRNISERIEQESRMQSLIEALENSLNGFLIFNEFDDIVFCNNALLKMFGYSAYSQISKIKVYNLLPEEELVSQIKKELENKENIEMTVNIKRNDNTSFDVNLSFFSYHDINNNKFYAGSLLDVTDSLQAKLKMKTYYEKLEYEFNEKKNALDKTNNELKDSQKALTYLLEDVNDSRLKLENLNKKLLYSNQELESFSYTVSHDLRAPLRAITGFTTILLKDYTKSLDPEAKRLLDIVNQSAQRMNTLIEDLLKFSRVGRHELTLNKVDTNILLMELIKDIKLHNPDKNIEFDIDNLPTLKGDFSLLKQVFMNLISNAVKFSKIREISKIKIKCLNKTSTITTIMIEDNGIGFNMKYAKKLFEVFQRLHNNADFEGTGVGLAIVKRIVNRHGGKIWAESEPNIGTKFYISLPVYKK